MSDFQIIDKDELTNVDRSADYILVYDFNAAKLVRSNVNSLLDLLSHPVGIDDAQTLTNKTITAPAISSPVLSGTITGTYTLGGTPTFPSSVVTLTGSQTLTNKVLTSPTINTANIVNPTLAVDTISEHTADNGVTIDGLNIKDGALTTANSVTNAALAAESVSNSKLNTTAGELGGAGKVWTPTLANISGGTVTTATYQKIGKRIFFKFKYTLAGAGVSGAPTFSTPTAMANSSVSDEILAVVKFVVGGPSYFGSARPVDANNISLLVKRADATYVTHAQITNLVPATWAANDTIYIEGSYDEA